MEASPTPAENEAPAPEKDPFISCLPELIAQDDLKSAFRATRKGIFVREDWEPKLIDIYRDWSKAQTGKESSKNDAKCHRRLFGEERPKLFYLLDGKDCLTGYLLRDSQDGTTDAGAKKSEIPSYNGELLDPLDFLHPKDPLLTQLENIEFSFLPNEGSVLFLSTPRKKIKVPFPVLTSFAEVARSNREILRKFPQIKNSLRECIHPLFELISKAKPSRKGRALIIPIELAQKSPSLAVFNGSITFLLNKESTLLGCYTHKGRPLMKFVYNDLRSLATKHPLTSVRGFTLPKGKGKTLGKINAGGKSFKLEQTALFQFFKLAVIPPKKKTKTPFPRFMTVRDLMIRLVSCYRSSKPADTQQEKILFGGRRISGRSYRVSGRWIFVINNKTDISACFKSRLENKSKKESENATPQKK